MLLIALYIYYFDRFFRYIDEIQCAAARVVTALRKRVADSRTTIESNNNINDFDTIHIRRGDFQFKETRVDADKIVQQLNRVLNNTNTLYIATDERKKSFFKPIVDQYANVFFLDDFQQELEGVNSKFLLLLKIKYSIFQNFTLLCLKKGKMRPYYSILFYSLLCAYKIPPIKKYEETSNFDSHNLSSSFLG